MVAYSLRLLPLACAEAGALICTAGLRAACLGAGLRARPAPG